MSTATTARRALRALGALVLTVPFLLAGAAVAAAAPNNAHLTRAPYLTDLVGLHVTVSFGTDRSGTQASALYGAVAADGTCTPTTSVAATSLGIAVGSVLEYQWKASVTLPAVGAYCYRVRLGTQDLLATNPSPRFTTQVPAGSSEAYSFAVFGDWGRVDANGDNPGQAAVMAQIAASGARFAVTTGDNGYPSGSQQNYGDLQQKAGNTSGIFGPSFWPVAGGSIPVFPVIGNHGIARADAVHPHLANWPQDTAVATSGGRNQSDAYPSVNGSTPATYPSTWYAFTAGNARFYLLDAAWADPNGGTATPYANDYAAHWATTSAEYQWLRNDLAAHPSGLKFAFFHYPLYSDQPAENSDASLQGAASLEGLLSTNGVKLAFSGHAHIYQRSSGLSGLTAYTTGGGGGDTESTGACSANDLYAVGWSGTRSAGTRCGAAPVPTAETQVFHFLKVTVNGSQVTVAPTDSTGRVFDQQTYTYAVAPETTFDSVPPAGTTATSATFAFHASDGPATFTCTLDGGAAAPCTSPVTYSGLATGKHSFTVAATVNGTTDPSPAAETWTIDTTPPAAPTGLTGTAPSAFTVGLTWTAATDDLGVAAYNVYRDGALAHTIAPATSFTDTDVAPSTTHQYALEAVDVAGNVSPRTAPVSVTTPPPAAPVFQDGFESGTLSAWTSSAGLTVQGTTVHGGTRAAEANTTSAAAYAKKTLPATYPDAWTRVWFDVVSQTDQINLVRLRDSAGTSLGYVYLTPRGEVSFRDDTTATSTVSGTIPGPGWHALEWHYKPGASAGPTGTIETWVDGVPVEELTNTAVNIGTAPVGQFQIGETQTGRTYDVVYDDAAFGTTRIGGASDTTPPSVPGGVTATATAAFQATVGWSASTDDVGVTGYDVFRDGTLLASLGPVTGYADSTVLAGSTHAYAVRARDLAGNVSAQSPPVSVTQPAAATPVFADGFESGGLGAWTTTGGLAVEGTDVRTGVFAAEGNTTTGATYAKKTLATTYPDAYARVGFAVKSQAAQVNLLRLRPTTSTSLGYVYVSSSGKLGFHNDGTNADVVSTVVPGTGWHSVELHVRPNGSASTVEVWLDGALVPALSNATTTMTATSVGQLQVGETQTGRTYDVVFDDAAFGTSRIGP